MLIQKSGNSNLLNWTLTDFSSAKSKCQRTICPVLIKHFLLIKEIAQAFASTSIWILPHNASLSIYLALKEEVSYCRGSTVFRKVLSEERYSLSLLTFIFKVAPVQKCILQYEKWQYFLQLTTWSLGCLSSAHCIFKFLRTLLVCGESRHFVLRFDSLCYRRDTCCRVMVT